MLLKLTTEEFVERDAKATKQILIILAEHGYSVSWAKTLLDHVKNGIDSVTAVKAPE